MDQDLMEWVATASTVLVIVGALLAWLFVIRYLRYRWEKSTEGRHLMGFTLCVALFLTFAVSTRLFDDYPGRPFIALGLYGVLTWLLVRRNQLLSDNQDDDDDRETDPIH